MKFIGSSRAGSFILLRGLGLCGLFYARLGAFLHVADNCLVSRQLWFPTMGSDISNLIANNVFLFPSAEGYNESLIWRQFAPNKACMDEIGIMAQLRRSDKSKRYGGFATSVVDEIRKYKSKHGHGFSINHSPREGIHHLHITYLPADGAGVEKMTKAERSEMKVFLTQSLFGNRSPYPQN